MEQFSEFANKELSKIDDIQLLILKGHIVIEYALNCYLEAISKSDHSDFFKENFSFSEKIKIAKHFGQLGSRDSNLIKELLILNKVRNDIAHRLEYSNDHLNELFTEVSVKYPKVDSSENISIKEKMIAAISFICGAIFGMYKINTDRNDFDEFLKKNK